MILDLRNFNGHIGRHIDGFEGVQGGNERSERIAKGRRIREFCDKKKESYVTNA